MKDDSVRLVYQYFEGGEAERETTPRFKPRKSEILEIAVSQPKKPENLSEKVSDCVRRISFVKSLIEKA